MEGYFNPPFEVSLRAEVETLRYNIGNKIHGELKFSATT
jgi:hypothetical protein